jgi:alkylated DNA repair dioxygenase AlkB
VVSFFWHRDDEADLVCGHPIASLSLGQPRDFIFRHIDGRGKHAKRDIDEAEVDNVSFRRVTI